MTGGKAALSRAYKRALTLEKAGQLEEAAEAWHAVLALDPADHGGAAVRLAGLGAGEAPAKMPEAYVRTLFDQQADRFDQTLVERLGYDVPAAMRALLDQHLPGPVARMLDLGCGTGLAGMSLGPLADHASGVDISERMLELADARGVYDELYVGDAMEFLAAEAGADESPWDLIVAADVLPYLGPVEPLFSGVAGNLVEGGRWLFSTEALDEDDPRDHAVLPTHRYAHSPGYLRRALGDVELSVEVFLPITVRHQEGAPVPGHLVLAVKG